MQYTTIRPKSRAAVGVLAILVLPMLAGCDLEFGNNSKKATPGGSGYANLYFETAPAALSYCTVLDGETDPRCGTLDVSRAPQWTQDLVSNPVGLQVSTTTSSKAALFNALVANPVGLQVGFDVSSGAISQDTQYDAEAFWFSDGSCLSSFLLSINGVASTYPQSTTIAGHTVSGGLQLDIVGMTNYQGCATAFQQIEDCITAAEQCGESSADANQQLHDALTQMFQPYVDAGAVTVAEISKIIAIGYQVSYR